MHLLNTKKIFILFFIFSCMIFCSCDRSKETGFNDDTNSGFPTVVESTGYDNDENNLYQTSDGEVHTDTDRYLKQAKNESNIIIWIVPSVGIETIEGRNLKKFNEKLYDDGMNFQLEMYYLDESTDSYNQSLLDCLKNGYGDLCFDGFRYSFKDYEFLEQMIAEGYYYDLSSLLESKKGETIYKTFTKYEWNSMKKDGSIYSLPNQNFMPRNSFVAFSKKYFKESDVKEFDGDLTKLSSYITKKMASELKEKSLIWNLSYYDTLNTLGIYEQEGYWFNHVSGTAEIAFSNGQYDKLLEMFHRCYENGTMYKDIEYLDRGTKSANDLIKKQDYGIAVFCQNSNLNAMQEDAIIVELPYYYCGDYSQANSLPASSGKMDKSLELLTLLYTNSEYANLICLGEEGVDYTIKNGYAYDDNGDPKVGRYIKNTMGVLDMLCSNEVEDFGSDIISTKEKYFASSNFRESMLNGFRVDYSKIENNFKIERYEKCFTLWQESDFSKQYAKEKAYFSKVQKHNVGILNQQVATWLKQK